MNPPVRSLSIFWVLYSLVIYFILRPILFAGAILSPALRRQLAGRICNKSMIAEMSAWRAKFANVCVFFCSSAGEYEQAKPLIDRLNKRGIGTYLIFFSASGLNYARRRAELNPYILMPWDSVLTWRKVYQALSPSCSLVVRHELWPAFLTTAAQFGALLLIDGSATASSSISRRIRARLHRNFDEIFVVDNDDQAFFAMSPNREKPIIAVLGDTKYDRVIERHKEQSLATQSLRSQVATTLGTGPKLIIGSAWTPDLAWALAAVKAFNQLAAHDQRLTLIVAPHDVSSDNVNSMLKQCTDQEMHCLSFSQLSEAISTHSANSALPNCLIVDKVGFLAELYGSADLAMVGGAIHHRVHNVLEPAAHGLPITCGPCYKHSREAVVLVQAGIIQPVNSPEKLLEWLRLASTARTEIRERTRSKVESLAGASDRILERISIYIDAGRPSAR